MNRSLIILIVLVIFFTTRYFVDKKVNQELISYEQIKQDQYNMNTIKRDSQ